MGQWFHAVEIVCSSVRMFANGCNVSFALVYCNVFAEDWQTGDFGRLVEEGSI